jgi:hypothetical protein
MGEKGHPGAEGMERVLRKWIAEARCEERVFCSASDRGVVRVIKGLNIQIWDSSCLERSAKRIV